MKKSMRLAKADMKLIELAVMSSLTAYNDGLSIIHTTSPRIEKLVERGFFDVISPELSGRRSVGYNLIGLGRQAFTMAAGA